MVRFALGLCGVLAFARSGHAATWFDDDFSCVNDDNFGYPAGQWGWQALLGGPDGDGGGESSFEDNWTTNHSGGISNQEDEGEYGSEFGGDSSLEADDWYENFLVTGDYSWSNVAIEADMSTTDDDGMGLVVRYSSAESYYMCQLTNDRAPDCNDDAV